MRPLHLHLLLVVHVIVLMLACSQPAKTPLFQLVEPSDSGITFANTLTESDSIHYFNFPYIYTGAGVGIADFNNDGKEDIFFSGNMVSSKLYVNQGNLEFKDITMSAGLNTQRWVTGVSCIDINNDGWMDIYLCVGGFADPPQRTNLLFVNNHDLTFTESAKEYGIDDDHYSTQAAFLDYDRDGDLDLYVMEHANESYQMLSKLYTHKDGRGPSTDRLFQNIGIEKNGHPLYRDVSDSAGILIEGYGLGLAILDVNDDDWPDIYVANDYLGSDLMYVNNRNGTFTNKLHDYFDQCSRNAMGIAVADINNDALQDIFILDMLPQDNERQKTMTSKMNYAHFRQTTERGFAPQFIRNTLQLNAGKNPNGEFHFQEIARFSGLHQTDWSWSPLIADFDNDGSNDIYITNGIRRDVTNHDFQEYTEQKDIFQEGSGQLSIPDFVKELMTLNSVNISNYLYKNMGSLTFKDVTKSSGLQRPSLSNGAAYADLDNDGDLEITVNNIDQPAFLYHNNTLPDENRHYIKIDLTGPQQNKDAIGSKVSLYLPNHTMKEVLLHPIHGYMSSIAAPLHIGLGQIEKIDSIKITWPGGQGQWFYHLPIDTLLQIEFSKQIEEKSISTDSFDQPALAEISDKWNISYQHTENRNNEFRYQPLLLQQYDNFGPGIAVSNPDQDGSRRIFLGGARGQASTIINIKDNSWSIDTLANSAYFEDMGALFFDSNGDGNEELYVVSGGSSIKYFSKGHYQDRLYVNDENGQLILDQGKLPIIESSGSCVVASDYDADGDLDLFVGGRLVPGKYPQSPNNYLLINESGLFVDKTDEVAPNLRNIGMVTAALWTDFDNDYDHDLLLVGEWMAPTLLENVAGKLTEFHSETLNQYPGWWNSVAGGDFDRDGDIDYVAGNLGLNSSWKASHEKPLRMYVGDFDENATVDAIFSRYIGDIEYPIAPRGALIEQIEVLKYKFPSYQSFAESDMTAILNVVHTEHMEIFEASHMQSSIIENLGNGTFQVKALPSEVQLSPVYGIHITDVDADGYLDIATIGNSRQTEVISGWHNAQKGLLLKGDGNGHFTGVSSMESGFFVKGEGRGLVGFPHQGHWLILAGRNNDRMAIYQTQSPGRIRSDFLPDEDFALLYDRDGRMQKIERYYGQGFLSQSSNSIAKLPFQDSLTYYQGASKVRIIANN
ncbi:MAG: VCBS repeat-containing protein [Saprospiraceae bacterium]|nr:VCBS repeat-containing protein [Saprospiraceae bacterium]